MRKHACLMALLMGALMLASCANTVPPFKGNDTGGIIAWSPEGEHYRHEIAGEHCARYGKFHRITSVHRQYGDYIGFACYLPRGYDPNQVVIRRAY